MSKAFIVLSMARTGSSLVARALDRQGVSMGDGLHDTHTKWVPQGLYEDPDFRQINIEILKAAGGKGQDPGHEPPSENAIISVYDDFKQRIVDLIQRKSAGKELWGWKNPRTALTIRLFHQHLTNPHYIILLRSPEEVGKSLQRTLGWGVERGRALTKLYNERIRRFMVDLGW